MKKIALIILFGALFSCGGGSGGGRSAIEGTWRGDLFQGIISCPDDSTIAACAGCVVDTVSLIVMGNDIIGSPVQARDGECIFEGVRTSDGFVADAVLGCDAALASLEFVLLEQDTAALSFQYKNISELIEPGFVSCTINPSGQVVR